MSQPTPPPSDHIPAWADVLSRILVWFGIVAAVVWLVLLAVNFIALSFNLVPSADIGMTFFLPIACTTGPVAALAVAAGFLMDHWVVRSRRR